jgi:hypothetical protein
VEQVLHPPTTVPVREQGDGLGTVFVLDLEEVLGHDVERGIPADFFELLAAATVHPDEGLLQAVRIVEEPGAAGAAGAKVPTG